MLREIDDEGGGCGSNEDVAVFVEEVVVLGRCSLSVSYCFWLFFADMKSITGVVRACGGVNDAVAIE